MTDFEMYSDKTCDEAIISFQKRLVEADNLMKDSNGMMNYEICWKAMRQEGPAILNVAKHLFTLHLQEKQMWENDMITDEDKAVIENG